MAKDTGVGAFQLSVARYRGGKPPDFTLPALQHLRHDYAKRNGFPEAFDEILLSGSMMVSGGSYHVARDYVRLWYCSDGEDLVFATYTSDWELRNDEPKECDGFVSGFSFQK